MENTNYAPMPAQLPRAGFVLDSLPALLQVGAGHVASFPAPSCQGEKLISIKTLAVQFPKATCSHLCFLGQELSVACCPWLLSDMKSPVSVVLPCLSCFPPFVCGLREQGKSESSRGL